MLSVAEPGSSPRQFDNKGQYITYAGEKRALVHIQDGYLFNEAGEDLTYLYQNDPDKARFKNILYWMNFQGYAMNSELRQQVVKMRRRQELEARMAEEMARLERVQQEELQSLERELEEARRRERMRGLGPIPPDPQDRVIEELELSDTEEKVLGDLTPKYDTQMPPLEEDEDFAEGDFAAAAEEDPILAPKPATVRKGAKKPVRR